MSTISKLALGRQPSTSHASFFEISTRYFEMSKIYFLAALVFVTAAAHVDSFAQGVPSTPVPSGYGHYCSVRYANGGWIFATLIGTNTDPCGDILKRNPGGQVERAGLWSVNGGNNVLVRCDGDLRIYRAPGSKATGDALREASGKTNCVFTVAPTTLPVFGRPYGKTTSSQSSPDADVSVGRGFDYNVYRRAMDVSDFGRQPNPSHKDAHSVDRKGRQRCFLGTAQQCCPNPNNCRPAGCHIVPGEAAYDLIMPAGKPIVAVADGIVRRARARDVTAFGCGNDRQMEVYIEHRVGRGHFARRYDEGFVSYYAHMSKINVKDGDRVARGQKIGEAGNTGCSFGNHLHLSVFRLTNLSGHRSYIFRTTPNNYGVNGVHGIIDPFGWAAPQHIDPWAWMFLGNQQDPFLGTVKDPGAFSINLWRNGEAPPSDW